MIATAGMASIMRYVLIFVIYLYTINANAQFENVQVKMQSGELVRLTDLPWFKFALNISESQWKNRATDSEWVVYAPPPFCPFGNVFRVQFSGSVEGQKPETESNCTKIQKEKLSSLPDELRGVCNCKLLLQTEKASDSLQKSALWKSYGDDQLKSDTFNFKGTLIDKAERLPIIFSIGGSSPGIHDFKGNTLCKYERPPEPALASQNAAAAFSNLFKFSRASVPVVCFDRMKGQIDLQQISFSKFRGRVTGEVVIKFDAGGEYVIKPD